MLLDQRQERRARNVQEFRRRHGDDRGRARRLVEQRDFAEHGGRVQDVDDGFLAIIAEERHLDPPLDDDQEVVARIALLKDDAALGKLHAPGHAGHQFQIGGCQLVEQGDVAEELGG